MAENKVVEQVVIEVTEKGARVVKGSIENIGKGAKSAQSDVSRLRQSFTSATDAVKKLGDAGRTAFNAMKTALNVITAPLRMFIGLLITARTTMVGFGVATLRVSGKYEMFRERLRSVTGSIIGWTLSQIRS